MGRRRDYDEEDDDDFDDDRPVRRPAKSGGGGKTVLIVLGIVGAVLLLIVGICGFFVYRAVSSARNNINNTFDSMKADAEAASFLSKLTIDTKSAYDSTAPAYKATTSLDQFQLLINRYPPLTKHGFPRKTTFNPMTGEPPNRKVAIGYELTDNSFDPPDFGPPQPGQPKPTKPIGPKIITVVMTVAEQVGGIWKVESMTVQ